MSSIDISKDDLIKMILDGIRDDINKQRQWQIEAPERLVKEEVCLKKLEKDFSDHVGGLASKGHKASSWKLVAYGAVAAALITSLVILIVAHNI